ncbi:MAG: DUF350 domain-containing protein [Candidatus Tectomicrobia bacterium]|uniref:DUF350 domain-containing protein n=1 Tax=Tectimicrobiota bacterium TaxID=2528274 RepID=A0A932I0H3_UNCTE|nr:DUF350 domain-containing protein [Candidatus Tectomicrobia bacterium]
MTKHGRRLGGWTAAALAMAPGAAWAQAAGAPRIGVGTGLLLSIVYGLIGILLLMAGYKVFEWITPFSVEDALSKDQNRAVGIVVAGMFLAIGIIIAAAIFPG